MTIELTKEELELLQAIFNSDMQLPVKFAEIVVSLKGKLKNG